MQVDRDEGEESEALAFGMKYKRTAKHSAIKVYDILIKYYKNQSPWKKSLVNKISKMYI